ncbi:MAG: signal peptidase I [Bacteroidetes bacterium]|nr:signal peptidase I [Bacteroidota bacterium]
MAIILIFYFAFIIFIIASIWKTFEKAGQPGWASIVPFYNYYIMAKMGGVKNWWLIFIPLINIYIIIVIFHGISKSFGKDAGFTVGLILLGFIFWPILGFGSAKYIGPNGVNEMQDDIDAIGKK